MNKKDFTIKNGTLIRYIGKSLEVVVPEEVTTISSGAIEAAKKVTLNTNCRKICEAGICRYGNILEEVVIPTDSKLTNIEKYGIGHVKKPVRLPDGIKVLNSSLASLAYIPPKAVHIKKYAISNNDDILLLPESVIKIDEDGLNTSCIYLTKNHKKLDEWKLSNHDWNIVYNIIDGKIYEHDGFKYVLCNDDKEIYVAIVSIPSKPLVIIPEKISGYFVRVVCHPTSGHEYVAPTIYVSKYVFQLSFLDRYLHFVLLGDMFHLNLSTNDNFIWLNSKGNVICNIKPEEIKHNNNYYYVEKSSGIILITYVGQETTEIYIPETINKKPVVQIALDVFQVNNKHIIKFIKYPPNIKAPDFPVVAMQDRVVLASNSELFYSPIFNYCNKSLEILDYKEKDGFKMLHIKDVDEEGYVIIGLDRSIIRNAVTNPPRKINGFKVLGISSKLFNDYYLTPEMASYYYSIYKRLY